MRCNDGAARLTSFLGGGECQLGGDYFWLCYSGIEKGTRGEKEREIEREKGRAWGKKKERRERRNA